MFRVAQAYMGFEDVETNTILQLTSQIIYHIWESRPSHSATFPKEDLLRKRSNLSFVMSPLAGIRSTRVPSQHWAPCGTYPTPFAIDLKDERTWPPTDKRLTDLWLGAFIVYKVPGDPGKIEKFRSCLRGTTSCLRKSRPCGGLGGRLIKNCETAKELILYEP